MPCCASGAGDVHHRAASVPPGERGQVEAPVPADHRPAAAHARQTAGQCHYTSLVAKHFSSADSEKHHVYYYLLVRIEKDTGCCQHYQLLQGREGRGE